MNRLLNDKDLLAFINETTQVLQQQQTAIEELQAERCALQSAVCIILSALDDSRGALGALLTHMDHWSDRYVEAGRSTEKLSAAFAVYRAVLTARAADRGPSAGE